jgi:glutathione S-transferase
VKRALATARTASSLFGSFSIADACSRLVVTRITTYGIPVTAEAKRYVDAMLALPAMQEWKAAALAE